jgi:Coenzyme PQQ synthesis protein D (PqqD)
VSEPLPPSPLSAATIVVCNKGIIDAEVDHEVVALSIEKGTCYGMNPVASRIWRLLAAPIRISELCATLLTEYEVAPSLCERQVLDLLEELRAEGMIATLGSEGSVSSIGPAVRS